MYQRGSGSILFIALVVPVIFVIAGVLTSMTSLTQKKEDLRPDLEQSILFGSKFLPDGNSACSLAQSQFANRLQRRHLTIGPAPENTKVSFECTTTKESIQVVVTGLHYLAGAGFTKLFLRPEERRSFTINYIVAAKARIQPTDTFIYFDTSVYMAPRFSDNRYWGLSNQYDAANGKADTFLVGKNQGYEVFLPVSESQVINWGNGRGNSRILDGMKQGTPFWTPSHYFRNLGSAPPKIRNSLKKNKPFDQAVQTQQCFNPVLSPIKYAAVELYDSFSGSPTNTISVATNNRLDRDLFTIRSLSTDTVPPQLSTRLDNLGSDSEVKDYDCLAASYTDYVRKSSQTFMNKEWRKGDFSYYGPPSYANFFGGTSIVAPQMIPDSPTGELPYGTSLRTRDAIWGRSVSDKATSLKTVLEATKNNLFPTNGNSNPSLDLVRAGLKNASENRAFLLFGDFPDLHNKSSANRDDSQLKDMVNDAAPIINQMKSLAESQKKKTYIFIVFTRREAIYGNYSGCDDMLCQTWYDQFKVVKDRLDALEGGSKYLDLVPIRAADPATVAYETVAGILRVGRTAILSTPE